VCVSVSDVVLVVLALAGQINSAMTLDLSLSTSGSRPLSGAMVERRDGPSWIRDDDDDGGGGLRAGVSDMFISFSAINS